MPELEVREQVRRVARPAARRPWAARCAGPRRPGPRRPGPVLPAPRTVRPLDRRCIAPPRARRSTARAGGRIDRLLTSVAMVLASATVVVLLGLLGNVAAGWNGAPAPTGPAAPAAEATFVR